MVEEKEFRNFLNSNKTYNISDFRKIFINNFCDNVNMIASHKEKDVYYYDVISSFDIETSSFRSNGKKCACMYVWSFGFDGVVFMGRTWEEFTSLLSEIKKLLRVNLLQRLVIYVHNLSYEFQFMRKWFKWKKVFALKQRTPIYALTMGGFEFRCSYLLSGYSLEVVGNNLSKYKINKLVGYLDYSMIRHSKTHLTSKEIQYSANDVKVVMAFIKEEIERNGDITKIPLTKTGYVRRLCRENCFYKNKNNHVRMKYINLMQHLTIEPDEYIMLKRAFQGGYTHANAFNVGIIISNVVSRDETSAYPTVIVSELFPMSKGENICVKTYKDLWKNLKYYCCLFDVEFINIDEKIHFEHYLSASRCFELKNAVIDNGRVVKADSLRTTITEQDFFIIGKVYTWEKIKIGKFIRYRKDYLPKPIIETVLSLYADKTQLKGVERKEKEYQNKKENVNACYGMMVTDIVRDDIIYNDDEWSIINKKGLDICEEITTYNNDANRFLFYPWGVWVTAYARKNLWSAILECGEDYIYSDTDSVKFENEENHKKFFSEYNQNIINKLKLSCEYNNIDNSYIEPMNKWGEKKPLGIWDFDGAYSKFKTLGAKRYLVEYSNDERNPKNKRGHPYLTVSGLKKEKGLQAMKKQNSNIFEVFNNNMFIPAEDTGKLTLTYIDEAVQGRVLDYTGLLGEYSEKSCIHSEEAEFTLSLSMEYVNYLLSINDFYY